MTTQKNTVFSVTQDTLYTLLITLLPNVGSQRYWILYEHFSSAQSMLHASPDALNTFGFLNSAAKKLILNFQQLGDRCELMQSAANILNTVETHNGGIISTHDDAYPTLLKEIHCPPPILYYKGDVNNLSLPQLAIVGSRHASHQGLNNTRMFSSHLANSGFTITSGLALGVDGAAHQAILSLNESSQIECLSRAAKTVAVMATGIDDIYPKRHRVMAHKIVEQGGTLVSEFPPLSPPKADHFPRRNRIISGLSLGVIVVEAAVKSGSLITAHDALEQGREVFAIPGSIHSPQSKGCHQLIKNGATLVENSRDIIEHLDGMMGHAYQQHTMAAQMCINKEEKNARPTDDLTKDEKHILQVLGFEQLTINQLIESTLLDSQALSACLVDLEINGWIRLSNQVYERV